MIYSVLSSSSHSPLHIPATCGTSIAEARKHGCHFDPMSFSWLPPRCYDVELSAEFLQRSDWEWYLDAKGMLPVPRETVLAGEHESLYVSWEYHLVHCTYAWRKMHRAVMMQVPLDGYIRQYAHTEHCERMLLRQGVDWNTTNTIIQTKFVSSSSFSMRFWLWSGSLERISSRPTDAPACGSWSPVASAIEYEDIVFDLGGMGTREHPVTEYEGPPNEQNNLKWYGLINAGIIALDDEMYKILGQTTEPSSATDDTPLIHLEVFHQLHCLNSLRRLIYNTSTFVTGVGAEMHVDHCIDYLRQTIMCHSDVTPITHIPKPSHHQRGAPWMPNFASKHTCRNFWKIHEWATRYNTSGWTIEGYPNQGVALAE
ncbi:hypothetical protein ASPZODRAFT_16085 [Penicilliopsis zonata CBS 506.65]|uniref:Uncharacterized protein n=1 Tax=Penicilliopsis zonata CBS 506.65 TaxID=1073090 RepID=A0A1L9SK13_9EURO|nr:hypothetical protein ASPZODRAFT_16085 [Penicilliopsis zonata CBS 506.65]OJJ47404.1 hypothetical protein ASPZODRAFT_16085 [Penicilliopsis zonata CBS 506.65]